jgi:hypothetical protein
VLPTAAAVGAGIRCPIFLFETRKVPSNYAATSPRRAERATEAELTEVMTHLAFYAGRPRAMSAITVAKDGFGTKEDE